MSEGRQSSAPSTTSAILASIRKTVVREVERGKAKDQPPDGEASNKKTAAEETSKNVASPDADARETDDSATDSAEGEAEDSGRASDEPSASEPDAASQPVSEGAEASGAQAESDTPTGETPPSSAGGDDGGEVLTLTEADMVKDGNEDRRSEGTVDDNKTNAEGEQAEGQDGAELLSAAAAAATVAALSKLEGLAQPSATAGMGLGNPTKTIEDLVREEIRPVLRLWLDENLPAIVETVVEREVERLVRARRR